MAKRQIRVVVNMPTTEEGKAELARRVTEFNTRLLAYALNKVDAPVETKLRYLESLNGVVPWAARKEEVHA